MASQPSSHEKENDRPDRPVDKTDADRLLARRRFGDQDVTPANTQQVTGVNKGGAAKAVPSSGAP